MKIWYGVLLIALMLSIACGGGSQSADTPTPTPIATQVPSIATPTPVVKAAPIATPAPTLTPTPTKIPPTTPTPTPIPVPTTISASGNGSAAPVTTSTPVGLAALCSLDQDAEKITCRASGAPEGTQSQLKWESNISGLELGPTYEIAITEFTNAVTVKLELCQGSFCEQVETNVDTSRVTPAKNKGESPSATPATIDANGIRSMATVPTPVIIESLTCDDDQITALYMTTCRAKLSGQVDWVNWKLEKGDKGWNRDGSRMQL